MVSTLRDDSVHHAIFLSPSWHALCLSNIIIKLPRKHDVMRKWSIGPIKRPIF